MNEQHQDDRERETPDGASPIPFREFVRSILINTTMLGTGGWMLREQYQEIDRTWPIFLSAGLLFGLCKWADTASTVWTMESLQSLAPEAQAYVLEHYGYHEAQGSLGPLKRKLSAHPNRRELLNKTKVFRDATDLVAATLVLPLMPLYLGFSAAAAYNNWSKRRTIRRIGAQHDRGELPALILKDLSWSAYNVCMVFSEQQTSQLPIATLLADARERNYDVPTALKELRLLGLISRDIYTDQIVLHESAGPILKALPKSRRLQPLAWPIDEQPTPTSH